MTFTVELLVLITAFLTVASSAILLPIGQSTIVPNELGPETLSERAFEGDIVLTQQQRTEAVTRKATPYSVLLWPSDTSGVISVPYTFGDSIINRTGVQKAIAHWQDKTCVTFKAADPNYTGARLIFLNSNQCASYIGRVSDHGQQIWLHPNCVSNIGSTVHEIGHALGFFHEQSRSDRDEFVEIKTENISPEAINNFSKYQTNNYEVPYDYHSVMHYGSHFFSMNGKATIVAKQVLAQPLLGNRFWLSFMDIKLANKMYGCSASWLSACGLASDACLNGGFTGRDCKCVCPDGTSGANCETLNANYTDALIHGLTPYSEEVVVTGVVATPGYPTPMQQGTRFIKLLRAPECHLVRLVVEKLDVYQRIDGRCLVDALAIRTTGRLDQGEIFCGQEISSGREFLSDNTTLILDYVGYDYASSGIVNERPGFIATVAHVRDPACGAQENISEVSSSPKRNFSADIVAGNCSVELTNSANIFNVRSPGYPALYQGPVACSLELHTTEPSYLKVKATEANFSKRDRLIFTLPGVSNYRISSADKNVVRLLISANSDVSFRTMSKSSGVFSVEVEAVASDCHQIIELEEGGAGTLVLPESYSPNTYCEWWIKAPTGKKIKLNMTKSFKVGLNRNCRHDKLLVNVAGDIRYRSTSTVRYCSTNGPTSLVSTGTQLNVLFDGQRGGTADFIAQYSIV